MHHRFNLLAHIIVLVAKFQSSGTRTVFFIDFCHKTFHLLLALFKAGAVVVTDNVRDCCLLHLAGNAYQMIETFVTFGMLRSLVSRKHGHETVGNADRVNHLILGIARMHIPSLEAYLGRGRIEVLEFKFTHFSAIHGIGPFATELRYIELMGAQTDFLIRIKADTNFTVLDSGVLLQIYHRRYNFGNTGFIIGTKQGLAVGHNQIFPLMVEQFGELGRRKNHILFGAKNNVLTVIILHDTRRNILATHIGACIHVGNKADDGQRLVCIGRKSGEQITIFVQRDFFQTQRFQFFFQIPGKHHLPRSTRSNLSLFTGLSIEAYVL